MILFSIIIISFFFLLDAIFLESFRRSVIKNGWSPYFYRILWAIGIFMAAVAVYYMFDRTTNDIPSNTMKIISIPFFIWYIPKLLIVPVMLIKKIIYLITALIKKIASYFQKNKEIIEKHSELDSLKRRKILKAAGWGIAAAPFIIVTDGYARETYNFKRFNIDVFLKNLPKSQDGLTIVQLSDIHSGSFFSTKPIEEGFRIVRETKPDILLITGDMVNFNPQELKMIYSELERTKTLLGIYGIFGNHDHWMSPENHQILLKELKKAGIDMLVNENRVLKINGDKFQLAGTDNSGSGQHFANLSKTLHSLTPEYPVVLMMHDPKNWDEQIRRKLKIDLMLSGHTHGGQIALDLFGSKLTPARIFYKQYAGLYKDGDQYLYVNRGFGTTGPPIRVGVPPEITVITLRSSS